VGKNRGLGRGLAALVAEFPAGQVSMMELELSQVRPNPRQPRKAFDREAIDALAESIKHDGVVQPIIVRDVGDGYEIVAGERRWRAAKLAGLRTIPALVRPVDDRDSLILALAENVAREDLNAVEQARAYAVLSDELDLSQTEIARRVGKSRPAVANTMRLLELPDAALDLIEDGTLSEGHGRAVLQVQGQDERLAFARHAAKRGLSVRETEEAARKLAAASPRRRPKAAAAIAGWIDEELANLAVDAAWQSLHLKAAVKGGKSGGTVEIRFETPAELGRIIDQLRAERVSWAD
jgi:ParB family transcriptional regulator, chromosome partitioning protein